MKLAARKFRKGKVASKSLNQLRSDQNFRKIYSLTADQVKRMKVRYVVADALRLRIILEVCAGMSFKTKWNDFNTGVAR